MHLLSDANLKVSVPASSAAIIAVLMVCLLSVFPCPALGSQQTVKIAAIYAYSGPSAEANSSSVRGVRMAVKEINAAGGILGRRLKLLEFDNLSTAIGSKLAALKAVQNNVVAIIGAAFSTHSIAVARVAQDHGIPMITNISTNPQVTRIGDYIFRICFNDLLQGDVMAQFARDELKARTVVTVFDVTSDYSMGLSETFEKSFLNAGGISLARLPYKPQQPNFHNLADQIRSLHPDVLFIAGHGESARIIQEAARKGVRSIPLGGDGWDDDSFYNLGGNKVKSGYYTTHWSPCAESDLSRQFVARHGNTGVILAPTALAYDAVSLLANAIKRAGSFQRIKIRDALAITRDFKGITGTISFDKFGDPVKNVVIMKIQDGRRIYLKQVRPDGKVKTQTLRFSNRRIYAG
jgi:branched-chain amino acid transport system substrate-binding protein